MSEDCWNQKGDEVVQLYIRDNVASVTRPAKELKGFKRVTLEPKEKKTVTFRLSINQLAFYDRYMRFVVEPGTFNVMVGSSSEDIRLTGSFEVVGETKVTPSDRTFFSEVTTVSAYPVSESGQEFSDHFKDTNSEAETVHIQHLLYCQTKPPYERGG